MNSIKRIKNNLENLELIIQDLDKDLKLNPNDFSLNLKYNALDNQVNDLREQLYQENLKREKEIIQIRLIGPDANFGTMPLESIGGITTNFSKSIYKTSKYLKFGNKGGKRRESIIKSTVDLRLEDIGRGSTIFYVSGKTSPDLFGESILQNSLENTFGLFNSENQDDITNNISNVGNGSLKYISKFLEELNDDHLECDLKWNSPDGKEFIWKGDREKILELYNSINTITISDPEIIEFEGELITISAKGKFELYTIDNHRIVGNFSNDLLPKMQEFHIRDFCKGTIEKTTIFNPITDKEKIDYNLISIG